MRIAFFGMEGVFSRAPLWHLLQANVDVAAVIVPAMLPTSHGGDLRPLAPPRVRIDVPLLAPSAEPTIVGLAWQRGIPVFEVSRLKSQATREALAALAPEALAVACFPRLLPADLLAVPRLGGYNVHPSLLPAYRGPEPLFWVFHAGLERAGVTVHQLDAGADTGDIAAQHSVALPDGIGYSDAQRRLSDVGGRLLVQVLADAQAGRLTCQPQPAMAAPAAPMPTDDDFRIDAGWTVRRAFNFMRGLAEWGQSFTIETNGGPLLAAGVADDGVADAPTASVALADGRLRVRLAQPV